MKKFLYLFLTLITSVTIQAQTETKTDTPRKGSDEIQTLVTKTGKVGVNMLKFMRMDAGISYRFTTGLDLPKTNSNLMNCFNANISMKFGRF